MRKMKKSKLSLLIPLCLLLMLAIGATYAYLTMQIVGNGVLPIDIQAGTADSLVFNLGNPINIELTKDNFASGDGNYEVTSTASAILMANDVSNHAEASYNVFLVIDQNEFNYTVDEKTPEILLEITPPDEETTIGEVDGLTKYDNAFDITKAQGVYKIATDRSIVAEGSKIDTWNVKVTVVNLETSQHLNADKTLNAKLYITTTSYEDFKLAHVVNLNPEVSNQKIKVSSVVEKGTNEISKYYYGLSEGNGEKIDYKASDKNNYTFTNLNPNEEYQLYTFVQDSEGFVSNVYSTQIKTGEYELPEIYDVKYTMDATSITVNVDAKKTDGIKYYYYSIDEGKNYLESDLNTYTFNDLMNNHNYQIKVKIKDLYGNESVDYVLIVER